MWCCRGLSGENTLTFTSLDWDTAQTVTVTAGQDADAGDDSVTLTHTAAGGEYEGVSADLTVTVVDDDAVIVFSPVPLRVIEGGAASYTVALAAPPSVDVTVDGVGLLGHRCGVVGAERREHVDVHVVGLGHGSGGDGDRGPGR